MMTLSLSVSKPTKGNGKTSRILFSASTRRVYSRTRSGAHSVHPVAKSASVNVCVNLTAETGPRFDTRSASMKPGVGPSQSEEVRTGMLRWMVDDASYLLRLSSQRASGRSSRRSSRVIPRAPPEPGERVPASLRGLDEDWNQWPQALAVYRSDASHSTMNASRTALPLNATFRASHEILFYFFGEDGSRV